MQWIHNVNGKTDLEKELKNDDDNDGRKRPTVLMLDLFPFVLDLYSFVFDYVYVFVNIVFLL